jgi:hypothetical protein
MRCGQVFKSWTALFYHVLAKYHDGYRVSNYPLVYLNYSADSLVRLWLQLDDIHSETIKPYKLFWPRWWLQVINWW